MFSNVKKLKFAFAGLTLQMTALIVGTAFVAGPDDQGCCVLYTPGDPGGEATDHVTRAECARDAKDVNVDFDFYPNKSCSDVNMTKRKK